MNGRGVGFTQTILQNCKFMDVQIITLAKEIMKKNDQSKEGQRTQCTYSHTDCIKFIISRNYWHRYTHVETIDLDRAVSKTMNKNYLPNVSQQSDSSIASGYKFAKQADGFQTRHQGLLYHLQRSDHWHQLLTLIYVINSKRTIHFPLLGAIPTACIHTCARREINYTIYEHIKCVYRHRSIFRNISSPIMSFVIAGSWH